MSTKTECVHRKTIDLAKAIDKLQQMQAANIIKNPVNPKSSKLSDVMICINVS